MLINALLSISEICKGAFDVGVIMDISSSIGKKNLPKLRDAVKSTVDGFEVSTNGTHFGIIPFAQDAKLLFNFAAPLYHDPLAIKNEVDKIDKLYPNTRTDKALILANISLFTAAGGDRPDKRNLLFVFTDGKPYPTDPGSGYKPFDVTIPPLEVCCRINRLQGLSQDKSNSRTVVYLYT